MLGCKGGKIVLFAPKYFGYEDVIRDRLSYYGYDVKLIYENMDKVSHYYKFIKSRFPHLMNNAVNKLFQKEIEKLDSAVNYVIVIRGEYIDVNTIKIMKNKFRSGCTYILYQWDGVENNPNCLEIEKEFDKVLSFDVNDCRIRGWKYRPLFFIDEYIDKRERDIDLLYICSLHSDRVRILNELKHICKVNHFSYKAVLYEKRYIFLKRKYIDKKTEYIYADDSDITFKPLSIMQTYKLYGRAKVVVDYTHPGQTGFTMRTIECIGNGCKMITNNQFIKQADFYNGNNIIMYDDSLFVPKDFVSDKYITDTNTTKRYSLDSFLEDILGKDD